MVSLKSSQQDTLSHWEDMGEGTDTTENNLGTEQQGGIS